MILFFDGILLVDVGRASMQSGPSPARARGWAPRRPSHTGSVSVSAPGGRGVAVGSGNVANRLPPEQDGVVQLCLRGLLAVEEL